MCPDEQLLSEYLDEELKEPWLSQILEHIEWCPVCKQSLENLRFVKENMKKATLEEASVIKVKDRVSKYMDKNIFNKENQSVKRKLFKFTKKKGFWPILSACLTFCFCLIIMNPSGKKEDIIPYPQSITSLEIDNVIPIRTADNYTTSETLKNYSLEEILKYLDDSGYEVVLKNKELIPLGEPEIHKVITPSYQEDFFKNNFLFKVKI